MNTEQIEKLRAIVPYLGNTWRYETQDHMQWFAGYFDGHAVKIRVHEDQPGKFRFALSSGELHEFVRYHDVLPSINVSCAKDPNQIAGEIQRRIFRPAQPMLLAAAERRVKHNQACAQSRAHAAAIAQAVGVPLSDVRESEGKIETEVVLWDGETHASFRIDGEHVLQVEIRSVPVDVAIKIAALLNREHRPPEMTTP